jgi:hypothetical protein
LLGDRFDAALHQELQLVAWQKPLHLATTEACACSGLDQSAALTASRKVSRNAGPQEGATLAVIEQGGHFVGLGSTS